MRGGHLEYATDLVFPVWSDEGGQDDIIWYSAKRVARDAWSIDVSLIDHRAVGLYYVDCYAVCDNTLIALASTTFDVNQDILDLLGYTIMGENTVSIDQMVSFYLSSVGATTYPSSVFSDKGAPTIRSFCEILYKEAEYENVRAEVLFAQVMLETGWLRFNGAVEAWQCNFGGLGAVDSNPTDANTFPDVSTGLRAQVQHLRAYADPNVTESTLHNPCVDVRFHLVTPKGKAPLVERLGKGNWATDPYYANKLLDIINALKRH